MNHRLATQKRQSPDFVDEPGHWAPKDWFSDPHIVDSLVNYRIDHATDLLRSGPAAGIEGEDRELIDRLMSQIRSSRYDAADHLAMTMNMARTAFLLLRKTLSDYELATCDVCSGPTGLRRNITPGFYQITCRCCGRAVLYLDSSGCKY